MLIKTSIRCTCLVQHIRCPDKLKIQITSYNSFLSYTIIL